MDKYLAISPIESRYSSLADGARSYFCDFEMTKNKVAVEVEYFLFLCRLLPELKGVTPAQQQSIVNIKVNFKEADYRRIESLEGMTKHDIKAVEYFVKEKMKKIGITPEQAEFVHFGLTSQDVVSMAYGIALTGYKKHLVHQIYDVCTVLGGLAENNKDSLMVARTHGQPAIPTSIGREYGVFIGRIIQEAQYLESSMLEAKLGGAIGNLAAHQLTYPDIDWDAKLSTFMKDYFGMLRSKDTTQVDNYRSLCRMADTTRNISNILIDMCRDTWQYISMDYFTLEVDKDYVGSSTMPQKINPIKFENAEGNLEIVVMWLTFFSNKLQISRLQRDLTDSTAMRNIGVPFAHLDIAMENIKAGLEKLHPNVEVLDKEFHSNYQLLAEAVQLILKKGGYTSAYEKIKEEFQGVKRMNADQYHAIISRNFDIDKDVDIDTYQALTKLNPVSYYYK